jgi:CRISPR-associated protein Cas2
MILQHVPTRLRGELSRWLQEPFPGVFIGHVSAMVRDKLWEKCCAKCGQGGVFQAWTTNNEQHFSMRCFGDTRRSVQDMDGLLLVCHAAVKAEGKRKGKTKNVIGEEIDIV